MLTSVFIDEKHKFSCLYVPSLYNSDTCNDIVVCTYYLFDNTEMCESNYLLFLNHGMSGYL